MWVYKEKGLCVDLGVLANAARGSSIIEERFDEVYGGAFENFTAMFRKYGGVEHGW